MDINEINEKLTTIRRKHQELAKAQEMYYIITTSDLMSVKFLKFKRDSKGCVDGLSSPEEYEYGLVNQEIIEILAKEYKEDIERLSKELDELLK